MNMSAVWLNKTGRWIGSCLFCRSADSLTRSTSYAERNSILLQTRVLIAYIIRSRVVWTTSFHSSLLLGCRSPKWTRRRRG